MNTYKIEDSDGVTYWVTASSPKVAEALLLSEGQMGDGATISSVVEIDGSTVIIPVELDLVELGALYGPGVVACSEWA